MGTRSTICGNITLRCAEPHSAGDRRIPKAPSRYPGRSTNLGIVALLDRLGPDHGSRHQDLIGLFGCSNCKAASRDRRPMFFKFIPGYQRQWWAGTATGASWPSWDGLWMHRPRLLGATDAFCPVGKGMGNISPAARPRRRRSGVHLVLHYRLMTVQAMRGVTCAADIAFGAMASRIAAADI